MDLTWITNPMLFLVNALAAFRLTRLVVHDAIPFGSLRVRLLDALEMRTAWARKPYPQLTDAERRQMKAYDGLHPVAYLVTCYWCAGFWVAVTTLLAGTGNWWWWLATPLAISAAIGLLANLED